MFWKWIAIIMITVTPNTEPYFLPTPASADNAQQVLAVLQTHFCLSRCATVDADGNTVELSFDSDYFIRYYNVETNEDNDDRLNEALLAYASGNEQIFSTFHGFRVWSLAGESIALATPTEITWDSSDFDTDGFITVSDVEVTIPSGLSGYYHLDWQALYYQIGDPTPVLFTANVLVNGSPGFAVRNEDLVTDAGYFTAEMSTVLYLEAGDTVSIELSLTGSGVSSDQGISGSDHNTFFAMYHLGI